MFVDCLRKAAAVLVVAAVIGCGTQSAPKPAETKAEPAFEATLRTLDTVVVASIAKTGPYSMVGQVIGDLFGWAGKNNVVPAGPPFGIYLTSPGQVSPESARYEVCVPVPAETKSDPASGVTVKKFGGMVVAVAQYMGPYDRVEPAYKKLGQWIADNGYVIAGPAIEYYLSDPQKTPAESLKTEIAFVIQPKSQ